MIESEIHLTRELVRQRIIARALETALNGRRSTVCQVAHDAPDDSRSNHATCDGLTGLIQPCLCECHPGDELISDEPVRLTFTPPDATIVTSTDEGSTMWP